ncbi:4-diphosphocytidyl-2C-methyl-D-erythritolkinase [Thermaerobacter marianensis DSM 12885]|uniref:4-diphosphocytidyl-2-C-methyl-D-erythritol kinase n=1 Tax=Thermaerobacter marianensis (strain ATCC 700841 / DSM 12885 / JCM 10246 / 7p75a) TaxID=644966 RepID=E6SL12_THEM7|nr:4-(cytidine 5'-diphospho)-2-C-methyl-D-erythritol kinase [Thermaerobacter marianensis]ADU50214.1 4-diphosphocytidyl-2C-methyl-D-erythritolkinase [Thermaerobacter marianensis DSM 12885]
MGRRGADDAGFPAGTVRLRAYAKVNLHLRIGPRRPDGYHEIDSVMHRISWHDDLELRVRSDGAIRLEVVAGGGPGAASLAAVPSGPANLAWRAARLLQEAAGVRRGADIRLVKRVAVGAGLGGGSADAAAVLFGLRRLWRLPLDARALRRLGEALGADVPFLLGGRAARVRGKGECIEPLPPWPGLNLVLVPVARPVSTAWAYARWDRVQAARAGGPPPGPSGVEPSGLQPETAGPGGPPVVWEFDGGAVAEALRNRDLGTLAHLVRNDFEPVVAADVPEVAAALDALRQEGALAARMSGSGPVVWGIFPNGEAAARACRRLATRFPAARPVRTL